MILETLLDSPEKNDFEIPAQESAKRGFELWNELQHEMLI